MTSELKFAFIGAGPIGGIMGAYLAHAGHYVVLCDILKEHLDAIKDDGLTITGVWEQTVEIERLAYSISELANFPEVNTIVLCTKAAIMPRLVPEIKKIARPGMRFICNQNGLDNEDFMAETFGPDNVLRIVANYAGGVADNGEIWMSFFNPPNYIGAVTAEGEPAARQIAEMMTSAGLETHFTNNIKKYEWDKVILNAALNPVCAVTQKTMRDMMTFDLTIELSEKLIKEGVKVAEADGITFDEGFVEHGMQYLKKAGYHKPSMLQDVERGAPTEIDWISLKIVEYGRKHGIETPYNLTVTALVKGLELKSKAPDQ
jgi:2-dehydropantoate 2-reductase